jgi:methyl-accepting chemotaxis protein
MEIRRSFLLLSGGMALALSANMGLQWHQGQSQFALTSAVNAAQSEALSTSAAMQSCSELTPLAVAWTLTRRAAHGKQFDDTRKSCLESLGRLERRGASGAVGNGQGIQADVNRLVTVLEDIQRAHADDAKLMTVGRLEREARPLSQGIQKKLQAKQEAAQAAVSAAMGQLVQQQKLAMWTTVATGVGVLVLAVLMLGRVQRQVMSGIQQLRRMSGLLAAGDLRAHDMPDRQDEFDQLGQAMNTMKGAWLETVREVQNAGGLILQFSHMLREGSMSIHDSNAHTAVSLKQANEAVNSVRAEAHRSTDAAATAESQAFHANEQARKGGAAVGEVVDTIQSIAAASQQISDIIGLIDGIAFQTNILALNAAVEAARAGSAGAGFAVVAAEVRALAGRSSAAASDVRALISASAGHVQSGVDGTNNVRAEIEGVASAIDATSAQIQSVAAASKEQSLAMDQIAQTVESIGGTVASNSRLVDDWVQCADALDAEAQKLNELAGRFQLG